MMPATGVDVLAASSNVLMWKAAQERDPHCRLFPK